MPNLLYYSERSLKHLTGDGHPESPERLVSTAEHLKQTGQWEQWSHPEYSEASELELDMVHDPQLVKYLRKLTTHGGGKVDEDTFVSADSFKAATRAAGGAIDATRRVLGGKGKRAFSLARPPGHHATEDKCMGFCLFNNVALAAATATQEMDVARVLVIDWDVHHGNGTQDIFWRNENVGFFSMHRYPFWPGSGDKDATGEGPGLGMTRNLPIAYGTDRKTIISAFEHRVEGFADKVKPELVLISAGFDAHKDDPVGDLGLEVEDFVTFTQVAQQIADTWSNGRIVSLLEGGYNPPRLAECVSAHLSALRDNSAE